MICFVLWGAMGDGKKTGPEMLKKLLALHNNHLEKLGQRLRVRSILGPIPFITVVPSRRIINNSQVLSLPIFVVLGIMGPGAFCILGKYSNQAGAGAGHQGTLHFLCLNSYFLHGYCLFMCFPPLEYKVESSKIRLKFSFHLFIDEWVWHVCSIHRDRRMTIYLS